MTLMSGLGVKYCPAPDFFSAAFFSSQTTGRLLSRITNDHSWVFEQVQAGMLTEAEAEFGGLVTSAKRCLK